MTATQQPKTIAAMKDSPVRSCHVDLDGELGRGMYCSVHKISQCIWSDGTKSSSKDVFVDDGKGIELSYSGRMSGCTDTGPITLDLSKYVVKVLRQDLAKNVQAVGKKDLLNEAILLSSLSHPNIVNLHATSHNIKVEMPGVKGPHEEPECESDDKHFLVLDRLYGTLDKKVESWKREKQAIPSLGSLFGVKQTSVRKGEIWHERVSVALDIACGLKHIHSHKIIHRDLKPENIGFDEDGRAKIFDFGLARVLPEDKRQPDGTYKITGNTGSARYMAPEVALSLPYNESADAYSFGILLWQMSALEKPFEGQTYDKYFKSVLLGGDRPSSEESWPVALARVMKGCWSPEPSSRPSLADCVKKLESLVEQPTVNLVRSRTPGFLLSYPQNGGSDENSSPRRSSDTPAFLLSYPKNGGGSYDGHSPKRTSSNISASRRIKS